MSLIFAALLTKVNDITTSFEAPPPFAFIQTLEVHKGKSLDYPTTFREKQLKLYPDLKPLRSNKNAENIFKKVVEIAKAQNGWEIVKVDEGSRHLEAVATTGLLHFKDDIVIEVRSEGGERTIHMRSRSRIGRSDFAANFIRIRDYFKDLAPQI